MKKLYTLILTLILSISLTACSKPNKQAALEFFDTFNTTLKADSGIFEGEFSSKSNVDSTLRFQIQLNQKEELNLAARIDLIADRNIQEHFIDFYIKDGNTYLNALGTRSKSTLANLGINKNDKLNIYNPLLSFTNDEILEFIDAATKENDTYSIDLKTRKIEVLFDSLGSVSLKKAHIEAVEKNGIIEQLHITIEGKQTINNEHADTMIEIKLRTKKYNELDVVAFPDDLNSY